MDARHRGPPPAPPAPRKPPPPPPPPVAPPAIADFGSVTVVVHPDAGDTPSLTNARAWQVAFGVIRGRRVSGAADSADVCGDDDAFDEYADECRVAVLCQ